MKEGDEEEIRKQKKEWELVEFFRKKNNKDKLIYNIEKKIVKEIKKFHVKKN